MLAAPVTVAASVVRKKSKKKKQTDFHTCRVRFRRPNWHSWAPCNRTYNKSRWSIYLRGSASISSCFLYWSCEQKQDPQQHLRERGDLSGSSSTNSKMLSSINQLRTRFVRRLLSRAREVGRSSAKRMYVHSFYVIHTHTYTCYVRIVCVYYTPVLFRVSTSSAGPPVIFSWAHTHTHIYICILACLLGRVVKKKIKESSSEIGVFFLFWSFLGLGLGKH